MMTRVKYFLLTLAVLLTPICSTLAAIAYPDSAAWNFGYFTSVALAIMVNASMFCDLHDQVQLKQSYGPLRTVLLSKAKRSIDQANAINFTGRGFILGMLYMAQIAILVYAGALILAGFIAFGYIMSCAAAHAGRKEYAELSAEQAERDKKASEPIHVATGASEDYKVQLQAQAVTALTNRIASVETHVGSIQSHLAGASK